MYEINRCFSLEFYPQVLTYFDIFYGVGKLWFPFIIRGREVLGVEGLDFGAPPSFSRASRSALHGQHHRRHHRSSACLISL